MRVEQAIYGQTRRGHALKLASDLGPVPAELTSRMDLPDTAPPGVDWSPYLSGFPQGDRFVIARTFLDSSATRSGFVVSHALIAPLDEMIETADIRPLLALLIDAPRSLDTLETLTVPASIDSTPRADDLVQTVEALTTRGKGPVVRVGVQGFEELVAALWFHLWPELRARFAFRLSFGPQDLVDTPNPSLVCTPAALLQRWAKYRTVGTVAAATAPHVVAVLTGEAPFRPLFDFSHEIGAQLEDVSDLALLDRAYELQSTTGPSLDNSIATIRLVERLSPNPTVGVVGKTRLLGNLVSRLPAATVHDILLLRNLGAASLPDAHLLWTGIEVWMATNRFPPADDESLLSAIDDALSPTAAVEAWRQAILTGLSTAADAASSSFPTAFWRWARIRPVTLSTVVRLLSQDHDLERRLCETAPPEIERGVGGMVMAIALTHGWLRLHGTAAGASLPPYDAIRVQLSVDTDPTNFDGVRTALKRTAQAQVIDFALELAESRVLDIAAEDAARQPQLLGSIQFTDLQAQALWLRTLAKNPEAWQGPSDPRQSFVSVIQNLLNGNPVNHQLIGALALTPVANLVSYPRYPEVWERVDEPTRTNLLSATAAGWLDLAVTDSVIYPPDTHLESALLTGSRLDSDLQRLASTTVERIVSIVLALPNYGETRFIRLLDHVFAARRSLSIGSAEAIGSVVLDRHWQRAVEHLIHLVKTGRGDLKPALRICHRMIGILTRWMMDLSPISEDEKWKALEDLATDLYPSGPDHHELWDRAGGKGADLRSGDNGQTRWHDAIAQIRRGKKPSAAKLLGEMKGEFPGNDQISYLARRLDFADESKSKRKD